MDFHDDAENGAGSLWGSAGGRSSFGGGGGSSSGGDRSFGGDIVGGHYDIWGECYVENKPEVDPFKGRFILFVEGDINAIAWFETLERIFPNVEWGLILNRGAGSGGLIYTEWYTDQLPIDILADSREVRESTHNHPSDLINLDPEKKPSIDYFAADLAGGNIVHYIYLGNGQYFHYNGSGIIGGAFDRRRH